MMFYKKKIKIRLKIVNGPPKTKYTRESGFHTSGVLVVFGRISPSNPPAEEDSHYVNYLKCPLCSVLPIIRTATIMMGMAQLMPSSCPNISFPPMAPSLAATSVTDIAVDLRWVGETSTPAHSK